MKNNETYLYIYTDCIATKGANKMILIDTTRRKLFELPVSYFSLINEVRTKKFNDLLNDFEEEQIYSFRDFILENDLGIFVDDISDFPAISTEYDSPNLINNAVIEVDYNTELSTVTNILKQLDLLDCSFVEIRFLTNVKVSEINIILKDFKFDSLKSIQILIPYGKNNLLKDYKNILIKYPYIDILFIYASPTNKIIRDKNIITNIGTRKIIYTSQKSIQNKNCGLINFESLIVRELVNMSENINHNSCLHKKISIDSEGNIKNCPSMPQSFGNIKNTTLETALAKPNFKKYWNITKDQIEICKDCEFRYICTDCRVYKEDPQNDYSKPLKCGYCPYTNTWEEWSTNPLRHEAIKFYDL